MHKARIYSSTKSSGAGVGGLELQRIYSALITLGLKLRKSIAIKFVMGGSTALYSKGGQVCFISIVTRNIAVNTLTSKGLERETRTFCSAKVVKQKSLDRPIILLNI